MKAWGFLAYLIKWKHLTASPKNTWFRVFIQLDNGKKYPISDIIHVNEFTVDFDELPGCTNGRLIILVSDGIWTSEAKSERIQIPFRKPIITILNPKNGQKPEYEAFLQLNGQAWDVQEQAPIDSNKLIWKLDGKTVGKGRLDILSYVKPGNHIISLHAEDHVGVGNSHKVAVEVVKGSFPKIIPKKKFNKF